MSELPPGVTIAPPPPELDLDEDLDWQRPDWRDANAARHGLSETQAATAFPEPVAVDPPETLRTAKQFGCSGDIESRRYREATRFRALPEMEWPDARIALRRLFVPVQYSGRSPEYVALAEFALSAAGYAGFVGRHGDHAVKLRDELSQAIGRLHRHLTGTLRNAEHKTHQLVRPITLHGDMREEWNARPAARSMAGALWTLVPTAPDRWFRVIEATPDDAIATLEYLRATLRTWDAQRPFAASIAERLAQVDPKSPDNLPTAAEYAEAVHIADMLVFTSEKLLALYAGVMCSMPVYRLYPGTPEAEAVALWWPWGRPARWSMAVRRDRRSPGRSCSIPRSSPQRGRRISCARSCEKTGINRTTAQRLTASLRAGMRARRQSTAQRLLATGRTKAEVAREVGLSASRISALFK